MGEKFEENRAVPVVRPAGGHLWWPDRCCSFQQLVLEGDL
jgi:hypothetical protein